MKSSILAAWTSCLIVAAGACASSSGSAKPSAARTPDQVSLELFAALQKEDVGSATKDFSPRLARALGIFEMRQLWGQMILGMGAFRNASVLNRSAKDGLEIREVALRFERGAAISRVVVRPETEKIEGLFFRPADPAALGAAPAVAGPTLPAAGTREQAVTVGSDPWQLPGILTLPERKGRFPAVLLVHGSGPQDRDESMGPNRPFRDIAEDLARAGVAVLRYDKRTLVHRGRIEADRITVDDEVITDAVAGLKLLAGHPEVRADALFVAGHSLGGQLAPIIAERAGGVAGLVLLAAPARPMPQAIVDQARFIGTLSAEQIKELDQQAQRIISGKAAPGETMLGVPAGYFTDLMARDVFGAARRLSRPVLLLRGERDYQVLAEEQSRWQQSLASLPVRAHTLPRINHQFIAGDGPPGPHDYRKPGRVDASVTRLLADFVNQTATGRP